jgi:hypothetical protein
MILGFLIRNYSGRASCHPLNGYGDSENNKEKKSPCASKNEFIPLIQFYIFKF